MCQQVSHELLQLFETWCGVEELSIRPNQLRDYTYPGLERMRKGGSPAAKQSAIPYNPSDPEAGERLLENFSEWNKKLSHLARLSEPD